MLVLKDLDTLGQWRVTAEVLRYCPVISALWCDGQFVSLWLLKVTRVKAVVSLLGYSGAHGRTGRPARSAGEACLCWPDTWDNAAGTCRLLSLQTEDGAGGGCCHIRGSFRDPEEKTRNCLGFIVALLVQNNVKPSQCDSSTFTQVKDQNTSSTYRSTLVPDGPAWGCSMSQHAPGERQRRQTNTFPVQLPCMSLFCGRKPLNQLLNQHSLLQTRCSTFPLRSLTITQHCYSFGCGGGGSLRTLTCPLKISSIVCHEYFLPSEVLSGC